MLKNKPEWMSETTWRAVRTFYQTFLSTLVVTLIAVLVTYSNGGVFDWNILWLQGVIAGLATGLAAVMNRNTSTEE